jgi:hypothetical protein
MRQNFSQQRWAKLKPRPVFNFFSEVASFSTNVSINGNGWLKMAVHQNIQTWEKANCTFCGIARGRTRKKT